MRERKHQSDCWTLAEGAIGRFPVVLWGVPGTGKTTAAVRMNVLPGQKVFNVTLTEDTPAAELRGHYVPRRGTFVWRDGPGVAAWRAGARLVLNEIDRAGGDLLTLLMAILDEREAAMLTLPTGEDVRPAPGFSVVATMNGDPGTDLRPALRDRFTDIEVDAIHPDALAGLSPDLRPAAIGTTFADQARRASIRRWHRFQELRARMSAEDAARVSFGSQSKEILTALRIAQG
jgi:MoxR-like ATPase